MLGNNRGFSIHEQFEARADRWPEAPALAFGSSALTYRALNCRANQLARHLLALGVGPEIPVGIYADPSPEMVIGMLGILKAGGVYVPIAVSEPAERLAFMLDKTRMPVLLAESGGLASLPQTSATVVRLDALSPAVDEQSDANLGVGAAPDSLAYILYDRGLSDEPTGVCVPHRAATTQAAAGGAPDLAEGDVFLLRASVSSSAASFLLWRSLLRGARLVLTPTSEPSFAELGRRIQRHGVTKLYLPRERMRAALGERPRALRGLSLLLTDGLLPIDEVRTALDDLHVRRLVAIHSAPQISAAYFERINASEALESTPVDAGPVGDAKLHLLDEQLHEVTAGTVGELYVAGSGLSIGYLGMPERTAERFIPSPFTEAPGARLFKTGERARRLPDGRLELVETARTAEEDAEAPAQREAAEERAPVRAAIAEAITEAPPKRTDGAEHALEAPPIKRAPWGRVMPLSYMQEQLWFLAQLDPTSPVNNLPFLFDPPTPLNVRALEQSLEELLRRHEALRSTFTGENGYPVQKIHPHRGFRLPVTSLEDTEASQENAEIRQIATMELRRPFDLARGPVFRALLLRLAGERHKLLLIVHHIAIDGFSAYNILFPELIALYDAFCAGQPSPLSEAPLQSADYAVWQRRRLQGDVVARHMSYWRQRLEGLPSGLPLPIDRPRPAVQSGNGTMHPLLLPKALINSLRALSRREDATLFTVMLAACYALLFRYTGQEDIVVGTIGADRDSPEKRQIFGPLINSLVLRATVNGDLSFPELVQRIRGALLGAREHSELPFEILVNELRPERSPGQNPLFQVAFSRQPSAALQGWELTHHGPTTGATALDLLFDLHDTKEGIYVYLQYSTDLFDSTTIARLARHYATLLHDVAENPDRPIHALTLLTEDERRDISAWNETKERFYKSACLHELFEAHAKRAPRAFAVISETGSITYGELNDRANRLGHYLRSLGVKPDSLVGLCVPRSVDMIVGLMGILKAGGAYVPLDPSYPRERLEFMLEDARVDVLVTQAHLTRALPMHRVTPVLIDKGWSEIASHSAHDVVSDVTAAHLAYVIYTSGSTGRPKGVALEHRGLYNLFSSQRRAIDVRPDSRILQFASLSFDVSIWEISVALTSGASLVIGSSEAIQPGPALIDTLRRNHVTIALLPPSILSVLPEGAEATLPALRTMVTGVEACSPSLLARWAAGRRFFNAYGPTEVTVYATACECASGDATVPIGRPIANMTCFVLDAWMQPVPVGIPGELYVSGPGLARCYINRPDITAERFIPNPFSETPGERMYKTGDVVRYLPDGRIEFLGRADQQVKIRGFRVELGEVEAALKQHPDVQDAVAVVAGETAAERRLVAFIVPRSSHAETTEPHLRRWLQQKVPDYLVPSSIVVLPTLPLTQNGKVDRRALAAAAGRRPETQGGALKGDTERMIASVWEKTLRIERVGPSDNFFDLGGNSLLIAQVHGALTTALNRELPMVELFQFPTVRALAEHLDRASPRSPVFDQVRDRARKQREAIRRQGQRMRAKRGDNE